MKHINKVIYVFASLMLFNTCNSTEPEIEQGLTLELKDVSCTEAWLQLTTKDLELPAQLILKQYNPTGDSVAQVFELSTKDSLLYIDSLLPNQTYILKITMQQSNNASNELRITTMDTTSHNFTWQTFTFGEHSSSTLYDVAIIDENNIWAVGEIYMNDSLGNPDPQAYNAVHWDGSEWELLRIPYYYNGQVYYSVVRAIYAFNENDIWFGIASLIHWNGLSYQSINTSSFFPALVNKIWGSSSSDLYVVGNGGNIAHYNGSRWTKIASGTTLNIQDIWGAKQSNSGEYEVVVIASNVLQNDGKEVMIIKNNVTVKQPTDGLSTYFSSVWFKPERKYYIVGGGIHKKNNITDLIPWYQYPAGTINYYYSTSIRGTNLNDILVCGSNGEILHFNGLNWVNYSSITFMPDGVYNSISTGNNLFAVVGYKGGKSIITLLKR